MLKYGKILYSIFPNKTITSRIDTYENLIEGLENNIYDFIFTTYPIKMEGIATKFILEEALDRIDIPILDDDAKIDFYISYKIENKQKISNFLRLIG